MHGLVNKALQELVEAQRDQDTWRRICERAGVDQPFFVWDASYDDAVTYKLVEAASAEFGRPPAAILEDFGVHWVLHTAQQSYGPLMKAAGRSLPEFLRYLPRFHDRIVLLFPDLRMPEFEILEEGDGWTVLSYSSTREGLQPFVVGLIKGLGTMFDTAVDVSLRAGRHTGLDHDEFLIRWSPRT